MQASSIGSTPRSLLALLGFALIAQVLMGTSRPAQHRYAADLPPAPPAQVLQGLALGDPELLSAAVVLHLQAFDDQPGYSIPFRELDYARIGAWLDRALALDPRSDYPQVSDGGRQRIMLDFVYRAFLADPNRRWRWLAHAAIVARHGLHDDALALRYAREIATRARTAPGWARQMHIFLLEDMGEREQAKILLGGLLASGAVTDPAEIRFLTGRLEALGGAHMPSGPAPR
jgi:hypothetical protein